MGANTLTGLKRAAGELLAIALEVLYTVDRSATPDYTLLDSQWALAHTHRDRLAHTVVLNP